MDQKTYNFPVLPLFPGETENDNLRRISEEDKRYTCVFCRSSEVREVSLGPLFISDGVVTHYFCLLFSAGLVQSGTDRDGILGFLPDDILIEVRRATRLRCIYCHTIGASIGCCDKRCKATMHFTCGLANGANYQFYDNFESYCINHSKRRVLEELKEDLECPICRCLHESKEDVIVGGCCKSAVFHKSCIQNHAFSAGYFFKCPTCNSQEAFIRDMKCQGIFVPEQDAAWEREPNAYQELLYQHSRCDAPECVCPKGREYGASKGQWLLARCRTCGAEGTHRECGRLSTVANWTCGPCLEIERRTDNEKKTAPVVKPAKNKAPVASLPPVAFPQPGPSSGFTYIPTPIPESKAPNRKARRTGVKAIKEESDDDVNLNDIIIPPSCHDFFPHSKAAIQVFAKRNAGLPDWRMFELEVQLVDLFTDVIERPADSGTSAKDNQAKVKTAPNPTTNRKRKVVVAPVPVPKANTNEPAPPKKQRKASTEKRNASRKRTSWQKGVVKPRKSKSKVVPPIEIVSSAASTVCNSPDEPSSSKAILEGIRRSQSSLMTWLTSTSEATKWVKVEKSIKQEPGLTPEEKGENSNKKEPQPKPVPAKVTPAQQKGDGVKRVSHNNTLNGYGFLPIKSENKDPDMNNHKSC